MIPRIVLKVAARHQRKVAEQPPGQRNWVRKLTQPINKPKGIDRDLTKENGESREGDGDVVTDPSSRDIQPKDVFSPTPDNLAVRNFAETGKDLSKALDRQVPKDKGYDEVKNLSQYLIWTQGGAEGGPQGHKE